MKTVLQPLASWVIEDAVPAFLDAMASAIEGLNAAWNTAAPVLKDRLWDGFLKPLAEWAGDKTVELIRDLGGYLKNLGESITEEDVNALIDLAEGIAGIIAVCKGKKFVTDFVGAIEGLGDKVGPAWAMANIKIGAAASESGAAAGASLGTTIFAGLIAAIAGWKIGSAIYDKLGDEIDEVLHPIFDKITKAWRAYVEGFSDNMLDMTSTFSKFGNTVKNGIKGTFDEAANAISDGMMKVSDFFTKAWEVLLGGINEYIEGASDNLLEMTSAFSNLGELIKGTFSEAAEAISNGMLKVADFIDVVKGGFSEAADVISDGLIKYSDFVEKMLALTADMWENIKETLSDWKKWFSARWKDITTIFGNTANWFKNKFSEAWKNITSAFANTRTWFSSRWQDITAAFSEVGRWFGERFTVAWGSIKTSFANVKTFFQSVWKEIKSPFSTVATWFHDTFFEAWSKVKSVFSTGGEIFSGIVDGISNVFKSTVNAIIDGLNTAISAPFQAINDTISWVRELKIDIPGLYWEPFGGLNYIDIPQIPKLATGTVVPANYGEFMAILGDNKRETEVVSPLSTIEQAVENVMSRHSGTGQERPIIVIAKLDRKEMYREMIKEHRSQVDATGVNEFMY